jgi:hypothetical protein
MTTTTTTPALSAALQGLGRALEATGLPVGRWRWSARKEITAVWEALVSEIGPGSDGWIAARAGAVLRERDALLTRITSMASQVIEQPDLDVVRKELRRLLADIGRYAQRLRDLTYDDVEMELGGSE